MSPNEPTVDSPGHSGNSHHDDPVSDQVTSSQATGRQAREPEPPSKHAPENDAPPSSHGDVVTETPAPPADKRPDTTGDLIDFSDQTSSHSAPDQTSSATPADSAEHMDSSVATLKPIKPVSADTRQYLTINTTGYVDPTPPTPTASGPPSRAASSTGSRNDASPTRSDAAFDDRRYTSEDEQEGGSQSEIQSIMEQFTGDGGGPGADEVMSPRLEIASPILSPPVQHPPRKSSLEHMNIAQASRSQEALGLTSLPTSPAATRGNSQVPSDDKGPPVPPKDGLSRMSSFPLPREDGRSTADGPMSPAAPIHRPPPPEPEPEPALPFDFHRFLEQLRNKKADPVARYLKSFLSEFGKRQWMVHEQVKIIGDFLAFIANKMAQCDVWREVSDAEFDNAREGMEKLVMNRLYTQTFSPAIPAPQPIPGAKPKKRGGEQPLGPGRRGQHQEDVERDEVLAQKISIYNWIREEHLDIPATSESGKRFLKLAQQGTLLFLFLFFSVLPISKSDCIHTAVAEIYPRIAQDQVVPRTARQNHLRAQLLQGHFWLVQSLLSYFVASLAAEQLMRWGMIGLLRHTKSDSSADSFMPLLIYVVLQANPEHLVSNVQYILRFRNQDKLAGEAGYYLSSLVCPSSIENSCHTGDDFADSYTTDGCYPVYREHGSDQPDHHGRRV